MSWRLYTRAKNGDEDVTADLSRDAAMSNARDRLVQGFVIIKMESDDGEVIEGKPLQELLCAR